MVQGPSHLNITMHTGQIAATAAVERHLPMNKRLPYRTEHQRTRENDS